MRAAALKAVVGSGRLFQDISAILLRPAATDAGPSRDRVHRTDVYGIPLPRMASLRQVRSGQQAAVAQLQQEKIYSLGRGDKIGKKLGVVEDFKVSPAGTALMKVL